MKNVLLITVAVLSLGQQLQAQTDVINIVPNGGVGINYGTVPAESSLLIGAEDATEGGQLQLNPGSGFTTAHFIDVYGNAMRFLRGTVAGTSTTSIGIENTGDVNIGTAIPNARFTIGNSNQFAVNSTGDLIRIDNVTYDWPAANASGALLNNGSGTLSWGNGSSLFTAGTGLSWSSNTLNSVWTVNGTHIYNNNAGNVGIGVASPTSSKLQVAGFVSGDDGSGRFATKWSGDNHHGMWYRATVSADGATVSTADAITFREYGSISLGYHFWSGGTTQTERFRITNDYASFLTGNVGIGNAGPLAKLHITNAYPLLAGDDAMLKIKSVAITGSGSCCGTEAVSLQTSIDSRADDYSISGYGGDVRHVLALQPQGGFVGIGTTGPLVKLDVRGAATVNNGNNYSNTNGYMASGSLTVGGITGNFGGGSGWNANTAGLMLETLDNTEIGIHDSGNRIASAIYFQGAATNRITIGRDMGWGTTPLAVATLAGTGTRFVLADANGILTAGSSTSAGIVTGSGTLNYIPKWTPNGSTLGNSLITDDATTITAGGQLDVTGGTGTGYTTAPIEIRTSAIAPRLAFHYSGVVASQIAVENSGRIAIRDNPGTGYENFVAKDIASTATLVIGTTVPTINGFSPANGAMRMTPNFHLNSMAGNAVILNWDNGTTGATQTFRIGNGASSDVFYVYADGQAFTTNWWRSLGNTGWFSQAWGGGIWMDQATYVRVYNGKGFTAMGYVGVGTETPDTQLDVHGKATISRDGATECCGNDGSLAIAESTSGTSRRASISFHNGGEAEGTLRLIQNNVGGVNTNSRRFQLFDNQGVNMGLELSGGLYYGISNSRTERRNNAGLQGNSGAQSGFFETDVPSNFYSGASSWQHLIDVRHNNPANNYAMQIAGSFFDQRFFVRKTNNNAAQAWSELNTIGRGNGGMISYVKNEYYGVSSTRNTWVTVTGASPWMDVRVGDQIKLDGMYYGRLTGGSNNEFWYSRVQITGQNGCGTNYSNQHDYWHVDEGGGDHDNFKPVVYMDVWDCNCTGQIRFEYQIYMGGDDNWEAREIIITGTRY